MYLQNPLNKYIFINRFSVDFSKPNTFGTLYREENKFDFPHINMVIQCFIMNMTMGQPLNAFANYLGTCDWSAFDKYSNFEERI